MVITNTILSQGSSFSVLKFNELKFHKESYLKNRLSLKKDTNSLAFIDEYKNRLETLPSVLKAQLVNKGDTLFVNIEERLTAYPFIDFGTARNQFWFALGGGSLNGFKVGHQFFVSYQYLFKRHNYTLYYNVPTFGKYKLGANASVIRFGSIEPLFFEGTEINYNYLSNSADLGASYTFNNYHQLNFNTNYFIEKYNRIDDETASGAKNELTENKAGAKFAYTYRDIEYVNYSPTGWTNRIELQAIKSFTFNNNFRSIRNELVYKKAYSDTWHIALRNIIELATNIDSPFAPFTVDSYLNTRGIGYRQARGTALTALNFELKYVIPKRVFPKLYKKYQFQLVLYNDQVSWRNPGEKLNDILEGGNYYNFAGIGTRILYLKGFNYTFRVDYGVNITNYKDGGFVIGVGQYF